MKRPNDIAREEAAMGTLVELTSAFEGIASMRIAQIKNQVLQSTKFFDEIWAIYSQLRVDNMYNYGRESEDSRVIDKVLFIIITAEGGFSGDIDQKLVQAMLENYSPEKNDIVVIGHHGATQLSQRGIEYKKYFKMPTRDTDINVGPIAKYIQNYKSTIIYYQEYQSLMSQAVKNIEVHSAVKEISADNERPEDVISELTYIFEPSPYDVASHLERSMTQIAISQLILNSKLAQYASRFKAMTGAHERANDNKNTLHIEFNRAKRGIKDERLKEVINSIKKTKAVNR